MMMSIRIKLIMFEIYFCSSMTTTSGHAFQAAGPGPGPGPENSGPGPEVRVWGPQKEVGPDLDRTLDSLLPTHISIITDLFWPPAWAVDKEISNLSLSQHFKLTVQLLPTTQILPLHQLHQLLPPPIFPSPYLQIPLTKIVSPCHLHILCLLSQIWPPSNIMMVIRHPPSSFRAPFLPQPYLLSLSNTSIPTLINAKSINAKSTMQTK